jgi:hypothetical protein
MKTTLVPREVAGGKRNKKAKKKMKHAKYESDQREAGHKAGERLADSEGACLDGGEAV